MFTIIPELMSCTVLVFHHEYSLPVIAFIHMHGS